jgi:hypothetical protein
VAVAVVEPFEVVEIQQRYRDWAARALRLREFAI